MSDTDVRLKIGLAAIVGAVSGLLISKLTSPSPSSSSRDSNTAAAAAAGKAGKQQQQQRQPPQAAQQQQQQVERVVGPEIVREQFSRNISFLGEEGFAAVQDAFVVVVGLGGVGSHAAHMLARSGIGKLRLIDFDQVTLSSLNRAALATHEDVGIAKTLCMKNHLAKCVPSCVVESVQAMFKKSDAEALLADNPTYVLDCIDNIDTKCDLLEFCVSHRIPVVSAMGAGMKADPSKLRVADISETLVDPLCRATRRKLMKVGINHGIKVVYSTERPRTELLPLDASIDKDNVEAYQPFDDVRMRVRIVPVLGTYPALFGNAAATVALLDISGQSVPNEPALRGRTYFYSKLYNKMKLKYDNIAHASPADAPRDYVPDYDPLVAERVIEEVWRGKCARTGDSLTLSLVKWDRSKPLAWDNLILLTAAEAKKHEQIKDLSTISHNFLEYVRERQLLAQKIIAEANDPAARRAALAAASVAIASSSNSGGGGAAANNASEDEA